MNSFSNVQSAATGRRKNGVARVNVKPGTGNIIINGKSLDDYFTRFFHKAEINKPLVLLDVVGKLDILVKVHGGGLTGQAGAIRHGLSRALLLMYAHDEDLVRTIRDSKFLTRDPRMVQPKRYGKAKARKKRQFSKR